MGHSLLSFILHTETNNPWSPWQRLNNETGLTLASYGQLDSKTHLRALQRYVVCFYSEYCEFLWSGISIDHEELLLWHPGTLNWHKILPLWQKWDGSWTVKQNFKLTNRLNQYSWLCHGAAHVQVLRMGSKPSFSLCVSIKVLRFSLKLMTSHAFCLSMVH